LGSNAPFIKCDQKPGAMFHPTWHCYVCCNLANGRVDIEDSWKIKSSFITKDEHAAYQLTRTKVGLHKRLTLFEME
jgi:hypothetical protein